jgi:hypothetical protein
MAVLPFQMLVSGQQLTAAIAEAYRMKVFLFSGMADAFETI